MAHFEEYECVYVNIYIEIIEGNYAQLNCDNVKYYTKKKFKKCNYFK